MAVPILLVAVVVRIWGDEYMGGMLGMGGMFGGPKEGVMKPGGEFA